MNESKIHVRAAKSYGMTVDKLKEGDVLFITDVRQKSANVNGIIRFGQSLQFLFGRGHTNTVHTAIVTLDDEGNKIMVDVTGKGVLAKPLEKEAKYNTYVYRDELFPELMEEAAKVAYEKYKLLRKPKHEEDNGDNDNNNNKQVSQKNGEEINYSAAMTMHAVVFSKLLASYHFESKDVTRNTFCSKFVIECIQVAIERLLSREGTTEEEKKRIRNYFHLEKTSTPKAFEHYLAKQEGFKLYVIPAYNKDVYAIVMVAILRDELFKQKGAKSQKTSSKAKVARKELNRLSDLLSQHKALDDKVMNDVTDLDILAAIMQRVTPLLNHKSDLWSKTKKFGLEKTLMKDERITELGSLLFEEHTPSALHDFDYDEIDFKSPF